MVVGSVFRENLIATFFVTELGDSLMEMVSFSFYLSKWVSCGKCDFFFRLFAVRAVNKRLILLAISSCNHDLIETKHIMVALVLN